MLQLLIIINIRRQAMKTYIETPKVSEILWEEFMEPNKISAYRLSKDIGVPVSRVQDILHDRRKITVDTSLRLALTTFSGSIMDGSLGSSSPQSLLLRYGNKYWLSFSLHLT